MTVMARTRSVWRGRLWRVACRGKRVWRSCIRSALRNQRPWRRTCRTKARIRTSKNPNPNPRLGNRNRIPPLPLLLTLLPLHLLLLRTRLNPNHNHHRIQTRRLPKPKPPTTWKWKISKRGYGRTHSGMRRPIFRVSWIPVHAMEARSFGSRLVRRCSRLWASESTFHELTNDLFYDYSFFPPFFRAFIHPSDHPIIRSRCSMSLLSYLRQPYRYRYVLHSPIAFVVAFAVFFYLAF